MTCYSQIRSDTRVKNFSVLGCVEFPYQFSSSISKRCGFLRDVRTVRGHVPRSHVAKFAWRHTLLRVLRPRITCRVLIQKHKICQFARSSHFAVHCSSAGTYRTSVPVSGKSENTISRWPDIIDNQLGHIQFPQVISDSHLIQKLRSWRVTSPWTCSSSHGLAPSPFSPEFYNTQRTFK